MARNVLITVGIIAAVVVGGYLFLVGMIESRGFSPPRAHERLVPELIGVVADREPIQGTCGMTRITLESGATIDLRFLKVKCEGGPWQTPIRSLSLSGVGRGLLYYGHDPQGGEWIAGASPREPASTSCPFVLKGQGYDEGDVLHLSSGLVVDKAPGFVVSPSWVKKPWIIQEWDDICVDHEGRAISLSIFERY